MPVSLKATQMTTATGYAFLKAHLYNGEKLQQIVHNKSSFIFQKPLTQLRKHYLLAIIFFDFFVFCARIYYMIKAVIFDYGNVISITNTGDCAEKMQELTNVPADIFRKAYSDFRFDFDRGLISGAEMYSRTLKANGYENIANNMTLMEEIARLDLESWRVFHLDVTNWGLLLQKAGFKLGILSNMPHEFLDFYEKDIPLFTAADCAIFSCRVHLIKPEPAIYKIILEGLNVKPEEAVFFDDLSENIEAANKLGIHGILWNGLNDAQKQFANVLKNN